MLWYLGWCIVANMIFGNKIFKFDNKYYSSQSWKFVLFISSLLFPTCLLFVGGIISTLIVVTVIALMSKICQKVVALLENKGDQLTNVEYIAYVIGIVLSGVLVRAFVLGIVGKIIVLSVYALVVLVVIYLDALELLLHTEDSWLRYSVIGSVSVTSTVYGYCAMISFHNLYLLLCHIGNTLGCKQAWLAVWHRVFGGRMRGSVSGTSLDGLEETDFLLQKAEAGGESATRSTVGSGASDGFSVTADGPADAGAASLRHLNMSPTIPVAPEAQCDLPPMSARYMRGCNNDPVEARSRWECTYKWRVENNIDALLTFSESTKGILAKIPDIKACYPHFFHGMSKSNSPVYYEKLGSINIKKLMGEHRISIDMLLKYNIFMQEYVWRQLEPDDENGKMITVLDVSGIKMSDMMGDTLEYIKKSVQVIQAHYVDRCLKMYIINAPFYFNMLWQVVSPLLNETTRNKVTIVSTSQREITSNLTNYIDTDQLPFEYSGGNKNCLPLGKHTNEQAYMAFATRVLENKEPEAPATSIHAAVMLNGEVAEDTMSAAELEDAGGSPERAGSAGGSGGLPSTEPFGAVADEADSEDDGVYDEENEFFDAAKTWIGDAYEALPTATAVGSMLEDVQLGYSNLAAVGQHFIANNDISSIGESLTQTGDVLTKSVTKTIKQAYLGKKNSYYFDKTKQQWVFEDDGTGSCSDSDSESSGCESSDESDEYDDSSPEVSPQAKQLRKGLFLIESSDEETSTGVSATARSAHVPRTKKTSPRKHPHQSPTASARKVSEKQHTSSSNGNSSAAVIPKSKRREDNICSTLYSLCLILLNYAKVSALNGWLWGRKHLIRFLQSKYLLTCCKDFGYSIQFCLTNSQLLSFYMLWNMILTCSLLHLPMFLYADRGQFGFHISTTNSCRIVISSGIAVIALLLYGGNAADGKFDARDVQTTSNHVHKRGGSHSSATLNKLLIKLRGLRAAGVTHFCTLIGVSMIALQSFDDSAPYIGWMMQGAVVLAATTVVICVSILLRFGVRAMIVKLTSRAPATFPDSTTGRAIPAPSHDELEQLIHILMDVAAFCGVLIGTIWNPIHMFVYIFSGNGGGADAAVTMVSPFMICIAGYGWLYHRSMTLPNSVSKQNLLEIV